MVGNLVDDGWLNALVGSSRSTRVGSPQRHRAMARICCSPPLKTPAVRNRNGARRGNVSMTSSTFSRTCPPSARPSKDLGNAKPGENLAALRDVAEPVAGALMGWCCGYVGVAKHNSSSRGPELPGQGAHQRRLAHTVVAEETDKFPLCDRKIDALQDRNAAVARPQASYLQKLSHRPRAPNRRCAIARPSRYGHRLQAEYAPDAAR